MDNLQNAALYLGEGAGAAIVVGLIEVCKRGLPACAWERLAAPLALVLGIAWNALVLAQLGMRLEPVTIVFLGLITGLSASGAYSGTRAATGR